MRSYSWRSECDQPDLRSLSTLIHHARRRKLDKFGVVIRTMYASGYFINKEDKAILEAIIAAQGDIVTRYVHHPYDRQRQSAN